MDLQLGKQQFAQTSQLSNPLKESNMMVKTICPKWLAGLDKQIYNKFLLSSFAQIKEGSLVIHRNS